MPNIIVGISGVASVTVSDSNTARAVGSGSLDVFATPMMIALMERAACECIADCLGIGETSVGTQINVAHTAASVIGANVTATATVTAVDGRKVEFNVAANDGEKEIGNGTHTRVVVDAERFMGKL